MHGLYRGLWEGHTHPEKLVKVKGRDGGEEGNPSVHLLYFTIPTFLWQQ